MTFHEQSRQFTSDIDQKDAEIICYCKISLRGYEAARILEGRGWTRVHVMEGGIAAWPYPRDK